MLETRGFLAFVAIATGVSSANAAIDDPGFEEAPYVNAGSNVTGIGWAPDGSDRLFVLRKRGVVMLVSGAAPAEPTEFATIEPVFTNSECGLVGMTFDPNYIDNRYVYFFVTVSETEQQIIRYTDVDGVGMDKTVIVEGLPTRGLNHDGGGIAFGPDGMLYWAVGDNGNGTGVDADLTTLAAKVGRAPASPLAPAPEDNPFYDGDGPNNDYVWARGFRNPFTMTTQPSTGLLWVNVVGTNYEQIFQVNAGDHAGYDDYEANQPEGFIQPVIKYRTNNEDPESPVADLEVTNGAVRANDVITFTTGVAHRLRPGEKVFVRGVTDSSFDFPDGVYVASVPSATEFTVNQAGPDATSGDGTVTTLQVGRALGGGTFYDATQFPEEYRGNFFFGDYITGRLVRAVLGPDNVPSAVDLWGRQTSHIDADVGPDGALYVANYGGPIVRVTYDRSAEPLSLIVSRLHVRMMEGGSAAFAVSLSREPEGETNVTVARGDGDADVTVTAGASLSFDASNWNTPQIVRLGAAVDADGANDGARVVVASTGAGSVSVDVFVLDTAENRVPDAGAPDAGAPGAGGAPGISDATAPPPPPRDAQGAPDARVTPDAGPASGRGSGSGCDCRAASSSGSSAGSFGAVALASLVALARRRRARPDR